jgi:hypothetical protein
MNLIIYKFQYKYNSIIISNNLFIILKIKRQIYYKNNVTKLKTKITIKINFIQRKINIFRIYV